MTEPSWTNLWRPQLDPLETVLRAVFVYAFAQLVLRAVGRKELGRYSTYDVVLLFLLTTALRQTLVAEDTSLITGFLSLATLGLMDWLSSYLSFRSTRIANLLQGSVRELVLDGKLNEKAMRRVRMSRDQLMSALRAHGEESLERVRSAYLEPNGKLSFLFKKGAASADGSRAG